jgi:hypothetical protein
VKRIWNWQLRQQLEWVRYNVWNLLQQRAPHPGNVAPARRVTSRVLNPDRVVGGPTPHPDPLPVRRGEGEAPTTPGTSPVSQQSSPTSPSPHRTERGLG